MCGRGLFGLSLSLEGQGQSSLFVTQLDVELTCTFKLKRADAPTLGLGKPCKLTELTSYTAFKIADMRPFSALLSYVSAPGTRPVATSLTTLRHAASTLRAMASSANEEADLHVATSSGLPPVFRREQTERLTQGEEQQRWDMENQRWDQEQHRRDMERWSAELQRWKARRAERELEGQRSEQRLQALQQDLDEQYELCRQILQENSQILKVLEEQHKSREMQYHRAFVHPFWIHELCLLAAEKINNNIAMQHGDEHGPGVVPCDSDVPDWAKALLKDSGGDVELEEQDLTEIFRSNPITHECGYFSASRLGHEAVKAQAAAVLAMADMPDGDSLARIFVFVHGCSADTV